jgi:hypothetical protein
MLCTPLVELRKTDEEVEAEQNDDQHDAAILAS